MGSAAFKFGTLCVDTKFELGSALLLDARAAVQNCPAPALFIEVQLLLQGEGK